MGIGTPKKQPGHRDVLQVPSSSPISGPSGVHQPHTNRDGHELNQEDKHKSEMRKRFYAHKFWPVLKRRFYYLSEPELFKAMVKGKGNLRDISQWLAENISLSERLEQYDAKQQAQRLEEDRKRREVGAAEHKHKGEEKRSLPPALLPAQGFESMAQAVAPPVNLALALALGHGVDRPTLPPPKDYADDEDASPVKIAGKARQKRNLSAVEVKPPAPDTKVHLQKPKLSILEKYRNRQQPRIDQLLPRTQPPGVDSKRRRLVRADQQEQHDPKDHSHQTEPDDLKRTSAAHTAALLAQKYGFKGDEAVPKLANKKPKDSEEVDELDALEEKIRANKKKTRNNAATTVTVSIDSDDGALEQEVFSDDMSAEDDDVYSTGITLIDQQILDFLNQAPQNDICDICNVPPHTADIIVLKRPFKSIYEVSEEKFEAEDTPEPEGKRKNRVRKPLGMKIIERTEFALKGYRAVDSLVQQCSEYGKLISRQMSRWGVKVTGEGELDMVDVNVEEKSGEEDENDEKPGKSSKSENNSAIEIGSGSDSDSDSDDLGHARRGLSYIRHKPTLLAPDVELKTYQQVGINWLHLLYHNKLSCILADEMGLGKTCQVIAFMAYLKSATQNRQEPQKHRPHLVVVPSSTLENWLREFHKFCPDLVVQAYYGLQAEREELRYELAESDFDVLVTTYNLATGAAPDFKFLRSQNFDMIVYDEGHMLKNSNSERYVKLMRLQAGFRLLLTGTPLQNNLKELVSLLAFMLPKVFVEKRDDLQVLFNKTAMLNSSKDYNPLLSQQAINKAKTMMTPFVLRRKKAQVLKYLPQKHHQILKCDMTPTQRDIYDGIIREVKEAKAEKERRKAMLPKESQKAQELPVQTTTNAMMSLRKAAMHPLLFRRIYTKEKIEEMATRIMAEPAYVEANRQFIIEDMHVMSDYELNRLCETFPRTLGKFVLEESKWLDSGKVTKLLEVVRSVMVRKEKVLVFSLFTQMLDVLEKILSFANIAFLRLDGQTTVDTRQDIIDRFYEDATIPVFLLSTKAGGFGINLVAANNVVIFDQSFNPHDDKQAEDRAHRVGQTQEVMVTKLISENTIDENILMLAENKLQLDQSISNEPNDAKFEEKAASMFEKLIFDS